MTRRAPSFARAFTGRWRITEMDEWDEIDLAGSAHITFSGKDRGELAFLAVEADLDVRYGSRDAADCAEFSWEGFDDGTAASGRGWAAFGGGPAVWSVTSSSTKGMTPASSPNASDFFNSLLSGSLSPTAAGAQQIENGVHRRPHFGLARPPTGPRRRDHWLQPSPLRVPKVARITLARRR